MWSQGWSRHRLVPGSGDERWGAAGTAHRNHAYPQNLLRVGSALLDAANKRHWELIQQTEGGTAWLLQHYEAYASALAQNMRHTYLSPFTIVTPNIGETAARGGEGFAERVPGEGGPARALPASPRSDLRPLPSHLRGSPGQGELRGGQAAPLRGAEGGAAPGS